MLILFLLIPLSTIGLLYLKDKNRIRRIVLNIMLIFNAFVLLYPIVSAYLSTPSGGNMFDENGSGVILWLYMFIIPFCSVVQLVLIILKIRFSFKARDVNQR